MTTTGNSTFQYKQISTPLGPMIAGTSEDGICQLEFSVHNEIETDLLTPKLIASDHPHLSLLEEELKEYFIGSLKQFTVPLEMHGTDFQKEVWNALSEIPYGETRSYTQQSLSLNNPKGIRAIASANGKNKIAILVPCHRVIGQDGSLTGYAGGLARKKWLLDHERKHSGKAVQGELAF